ncbi:MAG: tripartite tricarboxylate transporter TctB family protein [Roseateles asaccharophilus]|jgi:putative tricarboxylic transport membrane protein|uniref:Putative tricarboxylic transport membrane protein n=1 Tax=Roseateles asaccharophilus TaxID=582607 RepID=A0A4V3CK04_9BURK|nr:tripartite tricarboxylate transporter TctB family protein [Roseateles asaccharophilus]MDN3543846.1 tripartite tricarboxylate transporter TctB family protein [Roseateles asaccharophilus]TDP11776.1 putative tricarboxylic transport membrane protein [Roseateles asaccharophilus]
MSESSRPAPQLYQGLVGAGTLLIGFVMALGAMAIPAEVGYAGVGPNALPWLVAAALMACGIWLVREALSGGFRNMETPSGAEGADWRSAAWVVAGVVANAALITQIGFVLSCTLCYVLAVRGLRLSEGRAGGGARQLALDAATGTLIAAPVFWLFSKLLAINLPALVPGGWI